MLSYPPALTRFASNSLPKGFLKIGTMVPTFMESALGVESRKFAASLPSLAIRASQSPF